VSTKAAAPTTPPSSRANAVAAHPTIQAQPKPSTAANIMTVVKIKYLIRFMSFYLYFYVSQPEPGDLALVKTLMLDYRVCFGVLSVKVNLHQNMLCDTFRNTLLTRKAKATCHRR
jgi:hypothetical protein